MRKVSNYLQRANSFLADRSSTLWAIMTLYRPVRRRSSEDSQIIVAVTSYSARINFVHRTLRSLIRQTVSPARILLVLAETEFPDHEALPRKLKSLLRRHAAKLQIFWVPDDCRSYKKLLPALDSFPDRTIVTADDDVIYPEQWLSRLIESSVEFPGDVICHRAKEMRFDEHGNLQAYTSWPRASTASDGHVVVPTGVGGVLYPPHCLDPRVSDVALAMRLAPGADDLWFKTMSLLAGTPARVTRMLEAGEFPDARLQGRAGPALMHVNLDHGGNDFQVAALVEHFGQELRNRFRVVISDPGRDSAAST